MTNPSSTGSPGAPKSDDHVVQSLYAKAEKIYPREVHGLFARLRTLGVLGLLGLYYILPWMRWDGHQALLFDLPARKFHIFFVTLWPQDFFYLAVMLIIAGLTLFFVTALAGRIWCGYACPQTVWTEAFLWIERKVEGDRMKQQKLDALPLNGRKFRIKATKHFLWLAFAAWTGFTFVGYFTPIIELGQRLLTLDLGPWETFWVIFYGFATYGNAGFMREQVCMYMCPYARFQSAMFDRDTLIVSYLPERGEPRGSRKRSADPTALGLGDCIDCTMCVQVCPTGIDIRNGLQMECVGCAACVDACDEIMEKVHEIVAGLPADWTDMQLDFRLADERRYIDASILMTQINAQPYSEADWHWRINAANGFGHGASAETVAWVLDMLDRQGIGGELIVRDINQGRAEVVQMWGRPESVREEFRARRGL